MSSQKYYYKKQRMIAIAWTFDLVSAGVSLVAKIFRYLMSGEETSLNASPKNILIIRLDHLGDVLYTLPALEAIKTKYPSSKITYLVGPWAAEMLKGNPNIDKTVVFKAPWFDRSTTKRYNLRELWQLVQQLRAGNFDLGIDFKGYFPHILLMWLGKVEFKISHGDVGGKYLIDYQVPRIRDRAMLFQNEEMLEPLGCKYQDLHFDLGETDDDSGLVKAQLDRLGISAGKSLAVMHCAAGNPKRSWGEDKYVETARRLIQKGYSVILIGGKADQVGNSGIISALSSGEAFDLAGKLTLQQLAVLLKLSDLFVGIISFPAHLAAVLGVPVVCIFCVADRLVEWTPVGPKVELAYKDLPCQGCEKKGYCDSLECLNLITVDEVMEKVNILKGGS